MERIRMILKLYNQMLTTLDSSVDWFENYFTPHKKNEKYRERSESTLSTLTSETETATIPQLLLKIEESEKIVLESEMQKMRILRENEEMLEQLKKEESKYANLMKEMSLKTEKIQELEDDLLKLSQSQIEKKTDIQNIQKERDDFKILLEKAEFEKSNLMETIGQEKEKEELKIENERLTSINKDLKNKIKMKESQLELKRKEIAKFQKEKKKYAKNYKKMEQLYKVNEISMNGLRTENEKLKNQVSKLKNQNEKKGEGIEKLIEELKEMGVSVEKVRRIIPAEIEIKGFESEIEDSMDESFRQDLKEVEIEVEIDRKMKMLGGVSTSVHKSVKGLDLESISISSELEGNNLIFFFSFLNIQ